MTEQLALKHPNILFLSMHPGWVDTPGVEKSLPTFHRLLSTNLRSPAEGADTIIWLATVPKSNPKLKNGTFYADRMEAPKHLPLAWTRSPPEEDIQLMNVLSDYAMKALGNTDIVGMTESKWVSYANLESFLPALIFSLTQFIRSFIQRICLIYCFLFTLQISIKFF